LGFELLFLPLVLLQECLAEQLLPAAAVEHELEGLGDRTERAIVALDAVVEPSALRAMHLERHLRSSHPIRPDAACGPTGHPS
jgi:hypothetical protein